MLFELLLGIARASALDTAYYWRAEPALSAVMPCNPEKRYSLASKDACTME